MCARVLVSAIVLLCLAVCVVVVVNKRPCNSDFVFPPLFSEKKKFPSEESPIKQKVFLKGTPPFRSTLYDVVCTGREERQAGS